MTSANANPRKTRELLNFSMDSRRWNDFRFRDGDIVIGTWAKSGTTWTQQIISQLITASLTPDCARWLATGELSS